MLVFNSKNLSLLISCCLLASLVLISSCKKQEGDKQSFDEALLQQFTNDDLSPDEVDADDYYARNGRTIYWGEAAQVGDGTCMTYVDVLPNGKPKAVGLYCTYGTLLNLPSNPNSMLHCFDVDNSQTIDEATECVGGEENVLQFHPDAAQYHPFSFFLLNWNSHGHGPPAIYDIPHFDFHFFTQSLTERNAIQPGPCGILIDCDDFVTATAPIPAQYMPQDYISVGAAEAAQGNHLIDPTAPEIADGDLFTRTFIYGAYDSEITFYEPMITLDYLQTQPKERIPMKLPQAYQESGWYPTTYKAWARPHLNSYTISLENFSWRDAE